MYRNKLPRIDSIEDYYIHMAAKEMFRALKKIEAIANNPLSDYELETIRSIAKKAIKAAGYDEENGQRFKA